MLELAKLRVYYAIVLYIILSQEKLRQMRLSLLLEKKTKEHGESGDHSGEQDS